MFDNGWGSAWAPRGLSATGIAEVLEGYARTGGNLLGARRWAENPLTLTHVRWMGPRGEVADAVRPPGDDQGVIAEERGVWVALALGFPAAHPSPAGRDAPWLPLDVSPQQAAGLCLRMARGMQSQPRGYNGYRQTMPTPGPLPGVFHSGGPMASPPGYSPPGFSPPGYPPPRGDSGGGYVEGPEWAGGLRDALLFDEGVSVIPCIEIELPSAEMGPAAADAARAVARDAAATFIHATQSLRQVREVRGWRRGGRLVLAVRLTVAPGSGAATHEEGEDAVRLLAHVLAQRMLPYTRIGQADPGEWAKGQPLTE